MKEAGKARKQWAMVQIALLFVLQRCSGDHCTQLLVQHKREVRDRAKKEIDI